MAKSSRAGLDQGLLQALALGDVLDERDEMIRPALGIPLDRRGHGRPQARAILAEVAPVDRIGRPLAAEQPVRQLLDAGPILRVGEIHPGPPEQLFTGVAEEVAELLIDARPSAVDPHVRDADGRVLERPAEPLLALAHRPVGASARLDEPDEQPGHQGEPDGPQDEAVNRVAIRIGREEEDVGRHDGEGQGDHRPLQPAEPGAEEHGREEQGVRDVVGRAREASHQNGRPDGRDRQGIEGQGSLREMHHLPPR